MNQPQGFDCPGCAWPDPNHTERAEFCENGAKAVADEATLRRVGAEFFARHSILDLLARPDAWLNAQGRLTQPMLLRPGAQHYQPIAWQQAFELLGAELESLEHPDQAVFYTSGRTSNEAAFLYQLFVRALGTNNLPDCSNLCHESSGRALSHAIGTGKGTVQLSDFEHTDLIFLIGQNPGTNHPRMLSTLRAAKQRGAKIVAINPLREAGLLAFKHPKHPADLLRDVALADQFLQLRIGGDVAVFKALMKLVIEADAVDRAFVAQHTDGFDALVADLAGHSLHDLAEASGVSLVELRVCAELAIASKAIIACWAMGLTQHRHGVDNVQEVANFLLLRGMFGKPGAGACPVRGHSNVQGDRSMGITVRPPPWAALLAERFGFAAPSRVGLDTVSAIRAMHAGDVRVFFALGGNFLSATPDTELTAAALRRCQLTVHVSTKLNRAHLVTGTQALILPCLGRTEIDPGGRVSVEDSMSVVHGSRGVLAPASSELLSEARIVAGVARATLGGRYSIDWEGLSQDYVRTRELIAQIVPGFANFEARLEAPGGFVLDNPARRLDFASLGGRAHFKVVALPRSELSSGQLVLTTIRSHDQFNTTIYDVNDRYRGIFGHRRVLLMNDSDLQERGLETGARVTVTSHFRNVERRAPDFVAVAYAIPRGCAAAYFPEANVLVPADDFDPDSRTPASKSVRISVAREPE